MEPFIGEIRMIAFPKTPPPQGWAFCNGATMQIKQYAALYTLIGIAYGGDGVTTFNLPDLRGRVPYNTGGSTTTNRGSGGAPTVALTANQLPLHTHVFNASTVAGNAASPANNVWGDTASTDPDYYLPDGKSEYTLVTMNAQTIANAGANAPVPVQMPITGVQFIIALIGIFPPRP